jgi:hypothetical protein
VLSIIVYEHTDRFLCFCSTQLPTDARTYKENRGFKPYLIMVGSVSAMFHWFALRLQFRDPISIAVWYRLVHQTHKLENCDFKWLAILKEIESQ